MVSQDVDCDREQGKSRREAEDEERDLEASVDRLVPLEEVPVGGHDSIAQSVGSEGLEDGGTHVEVRVSTPGAGVDDDGVDRFAVGPDPDSLAAVVAAVPVVETLADSDDHVTVVGVPTACTSK